MVRLLRGTLWTVVWIAMLVLYQVVQSVVLGIGAHKPIDNMLLVLPAYVVLYGVLIIALVWLHGRASHMTVRELLRTTFSRFDRREVKLMVIGIGLFLIFQLGFDCLVATKIIALPGNQERLNQSAALSPVTAYLTSAFAAPVIEELLFRGLLMNLWHYSKSTTRRWIVLLVVAALFGAAHSIALIPWLLYTFAGAVLGYVYTATGKLRDSIVVHMFNNAIWSLI